MTDFAEFKEVVQVTETADYKTVQVTSFYRSFCSVLEEDETSEATHLSKNNHLSHESGLDLVRKGVIGRLEPFDTPFGTRPIVYADWTASGRAHKSVEEYLNLEVLPFYGNTHTVCSSQISKHLSAHPQ